MNNKAVLFSLLVSSLAWTQKTTSTPLSSYGLGEEGPQAESIFGAVGNATTAVFDSSTVNLHNPASYAQLSKGQPLFSFGLSSRLSRYTENQAQVNDRVATLNQIALVIPVNFRFGMALGLQPYSRRGYDFKTTQALGVDSDSALYFYSGYGSIQNFTIGGAYSLIKTKKSLFTIGVNGNYLFGSITNERKATLTSSPIAGGVDRTSYRMKGFYGNIGLTYAYSWAKKNDNRIMVALTFAPNIDVTSYFDREFYTAVAINTPSSYDTVTFDNTNKGKVRMPQKIGIGLNYQIKFKQLSSKKMSPLLNLYADYRTSSWAGFSTTFPGFQPTNVPLSASTTLSFGAQFAAMSDVFVKTTGIDFLKKWKYRVGAYSKTLPYPTQLGNMTENAVTLGIGVPITTTRTNSSLNLGLQAGVREGNGSTLKEQFLGIQFGLIIAPANYDKWFKKYKLD